MLVVNVEVQCEGFIVTGVLETGDACLRISGSRYFEQR
jgi:hypothetical protein